MARPAPNVVLIFVDNQPAGMLGCAGNEAADGRRRAEADNQCQALTALGAPTTWHDTAEPTASSRTTDSTWQQMGVVG